MTQTQQPGRLFDDDQPAGDGRRKYYREYKTDYRSVERDIKIDTTRINQGRKDAGVDPETFCQVYFPEIFYNPFTDDQRAMITAIVERIRFGGQQAIAAERGGGKSTITKIVGGVWAILYGLIDWVVIIRCNAMAAKEELADIKYQYETNELLADDFPYAVQPIQAIDGISQRAKGQTVNGRRSRLTWNVNDVSMPDVAGSKCRGFVLTAVGIDGAIRGLVKGHRRPRLVIGDDIETREAAYSDAAIEKNRDILDKDIAGLAGPGKTMAISLLCTIINRKCIAAEFTDPAKRPQFHGIRQRWIKKMPNRTDLWDKYIQYFHDGFSAGDPYGRVAFGFYQGNKAAMDAGADVSNPNRFIKAKLESGEPIEISSLQSAYNIIANKGWPAFASEYQNEPVSNEVETEPLTEKDVQKRSDGSPAKVAPSWAEFITAGVDIGGRQIHYVVIAWREGMIGKIIDYGIDSVNSPAGSLKDKAKRSAIESAILQSLRILYDRLAEGYDQDQAVEKKYIDLICIDSGYMDQAIYQFCRTTGRDRCVAVKGYGSNQRQAKYKHPLKTTGVVKIGSNFWGKFQPADRLWLYHVNSDHWKRCIQDSFIIPVGEKGALTIFGKDEFSNGVFAKQITAEQWQTEFKPGKGIEEKFIIKRHDNHFLDGGHYAFVAAAMLGLNIIETKPNIVQPKRISLAEIQRQKRAGK